MEDVSSRLKRKMGSCGDCDVVSEAKAPHVDPLYCSVCDVLCNSTGMMESHVNGKKHKKKMLAQSRTTINGWEFWCDSCLVGCNNDTHMKMHLDGKMHKANQESCKRRRLLQVEIKKEEDLPNCKELVNMEEEESTMKEACCNEKDKEIKQAYIEEEEEEEQIKPIEITEETCNFKEEELKVEEEEIKKDDVCDDEKMQGEANQIIREEKTETIAIKEAVCNTSGKDGLWCDICKLHCNSHLMMSAHRSGKKHKAKEAKVGIKVNKGRVDLQRDNKMREMKEETNKESWCLACKVACDAQAKHLKGAEHKAKLTSHRR